MTRSTIAAVQVLVAQRFGLRVGELRAPCRQPALVRVRNAAIWLARALSGASYPEIGQRFGGMDHSSIMWACRRCQEQLAADPVLRTTVLAIRDQIAVNLPDVVGVARSMHLTFQPGPPRVTIEVRGEQPFELAACLKVASKMGVAHPLSAATGTFWLIVPQAARAAWARVHGPTWHDLSFETAPDVFRNGRILLSVTADPAPPEVVAQIGGEDLVSAAALVEWAEVGVPVGCKTCGAKPGEPCKVLDEDRAAYVPMVREMGEG